MHEPHCNHDPAAVVNGTCECGARVTYLGTGIPDLDAAKRYLRAKFRTSPPEPPPVLSWPSGRHALERHLMERHAATQGEDGFGRWLVIAGVYGESLEEMERRHVDLHGGVTEDGEPQMRARDGHVHVATGRRFYVSVKSGPHRGLLLGPFASYMAAELHVGLVERLAGLLWASHLSYGIASSAATLPTRFGR